MRLFVFLSFTFFIISCELEKKSPYEKFLKCMDENLSEYVSKSTIQKSCATKSEEFVYIETGGRASFGNVNIESTSNASFSGHILNESNNIILTSYIIKAVHTKNYDNLGNFLNCNISECETFEFSEKINAFVEPGNKDYFEFDVDYIVKLQNFSEEYDNLDWYILEEKGLTIE